METNTELKIGDSVYLLVSPTNKKPYYRYEKCNITDIIRYKRQYSSEHINKIILSEFIDNINSVKFNLKYVSAPQKYHTLKLIDKIYLLDEKDELEKDIIKLNELLKFKNNQKSELKQFVNDLKKDWNYRSNINI